MCQQIPAVICWDRLGGELKRASERLLCGVLLLTAACFWHGITIPIMRVYVRFFRMDGCTVWVCRNREEDCWNSTGE